MEKEIIIQIIESSSMLLALLIAIYASSRALKWKTDVQREISLLKDAYFYRELIKKYAEHVSDEGQGTFLHRFRQEVAEEFGYKPSRHSSPSRIMSRLESLESRDKEISKLIAKVSGE